MADTVTAEVARVPRVSDTQLFGLTAAIMFLRSEGREPFTVSDNAVLDLRNERREHKAARATIADLERRLGEAENNTTEFVDKASAWREMFHGAVDQLKEHHARATTLQAERDAALARGAAARREGFEAGRDAAAQKITSGSLDSETRSYAQWFSDKIRALTPPDAPQEGDGG